MRVNRSVGRRLLVVVSAALALFAGISCFNPDPAEIEEKAGRQYLAVRFEAVKELNYYRGSPSSLALCVYQLTDRRAFDSLRDDPDCMATLLACEKFDETVAGRERLFVNPGECRQLDFERRRGVRYLALAAGFHDSSIAGSALVIELPPVTMRSGKKPPPLIGILLECDKMLRDGSVK